MSGGAGRPPPGAGPALTRLHPASNAPQGGHARCEVLGRLRRPAEANLPGRPSGLRPGGPTGWLVLSRSVGAGGTDPPPVPPVTTRLTGGTPGSPVIQCDDRHSANPGAPWLALPWRPASPVVP